MARLQLTELAAFAAVAEHSSFTKAAVQIGIALPTMSQTIRSLEDRLGVRLFNRTTRSVALTEAGDRLLAEVRPILEGVSHALESVNSFRDKPIGTLRLAIDRSACQILAASGFVPLIQPFLDEYPAIRLEVFIDDTDGDIVSGRFDAGIRLGHRIERDMTVLRITDSCNVLTVAAPSYLAGRPKPTTPQDLHAHNCIRFRAPWHGAALPWEYMKGNQHAEVTVDGSLTINDIDFLLRNVLDGGGVGRLPEPLVAAHLKAGRLVSLLDDWSLTKPGVFLYHPSRRQTPMPLQVFLRFVEKWRKQHHQPSTLVRDDQAASFEDRRLEPQAS
ncbi:MAG TPA: LysR family transcriptional regulator [Caulobacteraceae bacterium]|jgi:DNA-binding transcriptional LysR family regulator|nr:LysR family transcriptional regulator [Caulobacteraceae bacterium]